MRRSNQPPGRAVGAGTMMLAVVQSLVASRTAQGMSQADLAHRLAVSQQAVSHWETLKSLPTIDKLCLWCAVLGQKLEVGHD